MSVIDKELNESVKVRKIFSETNTLFGLPTGIFLFGILVVVGSYVIFKMLLLPPVIAFLYYMPMYKIHQDDIRGFHVWKSVIFDSAVHWESSTRKDIEVIFIE